MASRTERSRASQRVMKAIGGGSVKWVVEYDFIPNTPNTRRAPSASQDQDVRMDVDSEGGADVASSARYFSGAGATLGPSMCTRTEEERWITPHGEIVRRWSRDEWRAKEEIIKEKAMIIRCQRRRINRLRRRLQETKDRSFLANEMQALVEDVDNMCLDSNKPHLG
ncbi:hypothetical protein BKA70DRAFT_1218597 [Coprinopsis sp. MPI-PUGE-AT-0042]|nr:hypothetical protein BKA70DRAFT_1218597 [Coprinopsis sp. MPI-PUGE-AT-0042]